MEIRLSLNLPVLRLGPGGQEVAHSQVLGRYRNRALHRVLQPMLDPFLLQELAQETAPDRWGLGHFRECDYFERPRLLGAFGFFGG